MSSSTLFGNASWYLNTKFCITGVSVWSFDVKSILYLNLLPFSAKFASWLLNTSFHTLPLSLDANTLTEEPVGVNALQIGLTKPTLAPVGNVGEIQLPDNWYELEYSTSIHHDTAEVPINCAFQTKVFPG